MIPKIDLKKTSERIEGFIKEKIGDKKAIIGISGGLDSALVLKLCTETLKTENVIGLMLPTGQNKSKDIEDAINLAEELNVKYEVKPIDKIVNEISKEFDIKEKIPLGNVMARVRMTALYSYSNKYNGMVVGTGNKTEIMTGYFTKYGDGGVDIEPIGDLYKTHVRELAKYLEIPRDIIYKKPSAGLWKGQTDEEEIGIDYETLDSIIYSLENNLELRQYDPDKIRKIEEMISSSLHKRTTPQTGGIIYARV